MFPHFQLQNNEPMFHQDQGPSSNQSLLQSLVNMEGLEWEVAHILRWLFPQPHKGEANLHTI
jgi:hypothetical protein